MRTLSPLEEKIYNAGERLIPGITHSLAEVVRHRSSYFFFRKIIEGDLERWKRGMPVRIVDLGCGVGYGSKILAQIPNSRVLGVDGSPESIEFARRQYGQQNISYQVADLNEYIPTMGEFDYVVSRNVFEHIADGLRLAERTRWRYRLAFDVPYDEPAGRNPHHALHNLREEHFDHFPNAELFYQDLLGVTYDQVHKPENPNLIICIASREPLPGVCDGRIRFPLAAWRPTAQDAARYLEERQIQPKSLARRAFMKAVRTVSHVFRI